MYNILNLNQIENRVQKITVVTYINKNSLY